MKKYILAASVLFSALVFGEEIEPSHSRVTEEAFVVEVSEEEARVIEELVSTMGESSLFWLFANQKHVANLGRKTRPITSLQFLGYVFAHKELVSSMRKISRSSTKWKRFRKGLMRGLEKESEGTLFSQLAAFAEYTGANERVLRELAMKKEWNGFLLELLR